MLKKFPFILFVATSIVISSLWVEVEAAPPAKIFVNPQEFTVTAGTSFNVTVAIVDAKNIWSFQFRLGWNSSVADVTKIIEGDFPGRGGARMTSFIPKIDNTAGYVLVGNALVGLPKQGENGAGALATITFSAKVSGQTGLFLYDVGMIDSFERILPYTLEDGYINVTAPMFHVSPSTITDPSLLPGETFTINVTLTDVTDLKSLEFKLRYNATLINATSISAVKFLNDPSTVNTVINTTANFVWISVNASDAEPVSGSGVIANVTFVTNAIGEGILDIYDTKIDDKIARSRTPVLENRPPAEDGYFSNIPAGHDIAVSRMTALYVTVTEGDSIPINVTVKNIGAYNETFSLALFYGTTLIENKTSIDLDVGHTTVQSFTWDTTGVAAGTYTLKAQASQVQGETKVSNNVYVFPKPITVQGKSTSTDIWLYVGIAAVAIVVIIALAYFFKFRK